MRTRRLMGLGMLAGFIFGMMVVTAYVIRALIGDGQPIVVVLSIGAAILVPLQTGLVAIALPLLALMDGDDNDTTDER